MIFHWETAALLHSTYIDIPPFFFRVDVCVGERGRGISLKEVSVGCSAAIDWSRGNPFSYLFTVARQPEPIAC